MPKLGNLSYRDVVRLLASEGFVLIRQEGSHVAFQGPKVDRLTAEMSGRRINILNGYGLPPVLGKEKNI
ncbi:MAG TPA: type II toxin-antitoxin system HicA family toxin [Bdellovibrionota bacterium]|nr:type II toxin-antitoxin system HicA family toxin [Bdellovibrionota bacterium]